MEPSRCRPVLVEYPLRISLARIVGLIGCTLLVAAGMAWLAHGNERGLSFWNVIELSPEQATIFFAFFAAVIFFAVLPYACALSLRSLLLAQRIAFVAEGVLLPASAWSGREHELRYAEIEDLCLFAIGNEELATVSWGGRKFRIGQSWLPSAAAFDDVVLRLEQGMEQTRGERRAG